MEAEGMLQSARHIQVISRSQQTDEREGTSNKRDVRTQREVIPMYLLT